MKAVKITADTNMYYGLVCRQHTRSRLREQDINPMQNALGKYPATAASDRN
jgi:hypothetical protein